MPVWLFGRKANKTIMRINICFSFVLSITYFLYFVNFYELNHTLVTPLPGRYRVSFFSLLGVLVIKKHLHALACKHSLVS